MYSIRLMLSAGVLCAAFLCAVAAAQEVYHGPAPPLELNITSRLEDYILENRRQYNNNIADMQQEIKHFQESFERQMKVLDKFNAATETKLEQSQSSLQPLEVLNPFTKHCVQSNIWRLSNLKPTFNKLAICVNTGRGSINSLVSAIDSNMRTLNTYYTVTLDKALNKCLDANSTQLVKTLCITDVISAANAYTISLRNTFTSNLRQAFCSADIRVGITVDCVHDLTYDVIYTIGQTTSLIETCIKQAGREQSCRQSCPNVLQLSFEAAVRSNATITNPLHQIEMDRSAKCLQVNFV